MQEIRTPTPILYFPEPELPSDEQFARYFPVREISMPLTSNFLVKVCIKPPVCMSHMVISRNRR